MDPCRILIVEDEAVVALDIEERLIGLGCAIAGHAVSGGKALELAEALSPDLVLMDIRLKGDMDGIATAMEMRLRFRLPVVFLTAYSEDRTLQRAKTAEPFGYLLKPFNDRELKSTIEMALHKHGVDERLMQLNRLFDTLSQVNQTIMRTRSRDDLLPAVCRVVVEHAGVDLAWIGRMEGDSPGIIPLACVGRDGRDLRSFELTSAGIHEVEIRVAGAIRAGLPFVCPSHGSTACLHGPFVDLLTVRPAFHSCASFPFQMGGESCGTLILCSERKGFFGEQEIHVFKELALDVGLALEMIEADDRRKQAEEALRDSKELLDKILDSIGDPIFVKDEEHRFVLVNEAQCRLAGREREALLGKTDYDCFPPEQVKVFWAKDEEVMETGRESVNEEIITNAGGEVRTLVTRKNRCMDPRGRSYVVGVIHDITERKRADAIRQARLRLMNLALTRSLDELLQATLDEAEALTGSSIGFYHFLESDQQTLSLQAWSSRTHKEFCRAEGRRLHYTVAEAGVWVDCIHQRKPVIHNDYESLPHRKGMPPGHARVSRELVVPVFRGDRIVAILGVGNKPGDYDASDIEAVSHLADLAWDIAEHKLATESIVERDRRMRTLFENLPGVVYRCSNDRDWTMEFLSEGCKGLTGYAPEDLIGNRRLSFNDMVHPDDRQWLWDRWQEVLEERAAFQGEYRIIDASGAEKWIWESGSPIFDDAGHVLALEGFIMDITVRRCAEEMLRKSEARYRSVVEDAPIMISTYLPDTTLVFVNDASCRYFGRSREELIGRRFLDWLPESAREDILGTIAALTPEAPTAVLETEYVAEDGTLHFQRWTNRAIFDQAGKPVLYQGFGEDITEQKTSQADLLRLATAIDQAGETVLITDARGVIQYINPAFERTTGYTREEAMGKTAKILKSGRQDQSFREEMRRTLFSGSVWVGRFTNKRKDGTLFEEEAVISPVRDPQGNITQLVAVKRDISKEVELEAKLRQVQKMEAVGQLAGGVAHDFNNMLSPILGYAEMLLDDLHPADDRYDQVMEIKKAAERSRDLVRQLLAFSRKQILQVRLVVLSQVVENMEKLLRRTLREDISLRIVPSPVTCAVMADVGQLEQVLMNLVVNAQDAMPAGGSLTIEVSRAELTEGDCVGQPGSLPGKYGVLVVRDTGSGMDDETLEHIFEPFYSTKGERGTGLGLATVYGVVKQHHGNILVESRRGEGTVFRVFLPEENREAAAHDRTPSTQARLGGAETILVVEDDEMVLRMACSLLMRQGYTVLPAASGSQALAVLEHHPGPVHLLLTDVVMPGMNGRELYEELVRGSPGLRVLYMSGYTDEVIARSGLLEEDTHLIQKPFSARDLPLRVRQVLDNP
ncbi:MAG: PAS domain S-box protein [Syntrophobacteraceae bacterium]